MAAKNLAFSDEYFPHDYNARGDQKCVRLTIKMGWAGYGLYWAVIEMLYQARGRLAPDYAVIAHTLRTKAEIVKEVVESFDLFYFTAEKDQFGSRSVDRRLRVRKEKTIKAKASADERWRKAKALREESERNANALRAESEGNARKESKGEERKLNSDFTGNPQDQQVARVIEFYLKNRNRPTDQGHLLTAIVEHRSAALRLLDMCRQDPVLACDQITKIAIHLDHEARLGKLKNWGKLDAIANTLEARRATGSRL